MDNKWHYTENNDYPEVFGQYKDQHYPEIPCLAEDIGLIDIIYWNVTEQCWDNHDCDDYLCDKEKIIRWRYLDSLLQEK